MKRKFLRLISFVLLMTTLVGCSSKSFEEDEYLECRQKASKQIVASCNKVNDYLIILCTCKGSKILLVCEYDADFILALKKSVASFGVFSKEFNKFKVK